MQLGPDHLLNQKCEDRLKWSVLLYGNDHIRYDHIRGNRSTLLQC